MTMKSVVVILIIVIVGIIGTTITEIYENNYNEHLNCDDSKKNITIEIMSRFGVRCDGLMVSTIIKHKYRENEIFNETTDSCGEIHVPIFHGTPYNITIFNGSGGIIKNVEFIPHNTEYTIYLNA